MKQIFRSFTLVALAFSLHACQENGSNDSGGNSKSSDPVSLERDNVKPAAVANYEEKVDDKLNDWKFSAKLFETKERFRYLLDMQYQEMTASDTIRFPNFGVEPEPRIQKGENKLECIIGFLDKEGKFREYLKVFVEDEQLRVKTLKHYSVVEKTE